jgi:beta-N-acetylhexosaminidase
LKKSSKKPNTFFMANMRFIYASIICLLLLPSCVKRKTVNQESNMVNEAKNEVSVDEIFEKWQRATDIAASLDDRLLAAQVLISGIEGKGSLNSNIVSLLSEFPTGGIMLFKYNLDTDNDSIRALINQTASLVKGESGIMPFIAVDHEGGTVNRFRRGTADLPDASSYWELSLARDRQTSFNKIENDSLRAGKDLKDLGINVNFAPVAEYLNDSNRVFLSRRSYGPDPLFTANAAQAFIMGMEQAGVLCVIKHFPGIAGSDPHYRASVINADKAELDKLVFPFKALIDNIYGGGAMMVSHTLVPALDGKIASLSKVVMEDWLRGELGFSGLLIADDFSMAAAGNKSPEEAAVQSIAAGADMVLVWPKDLRRTHGAIMYALYDGRLSRERLRKIAYRIIIKKINMGLM